MITYTSDIIQMDPTLVPTFNYYVNGKPVYVQSFGYDSEWFNIFIDCLPTTYLISDLIEFIGDTLDSKVYIYDNQFNLLNATLQCS